jgi:hypothetical protein
MKKEYDVYFLKSIFQKVEIYINLNPPQNTFKELGKFFILRGGWGEGWLRCPLCCRKKMLKNWKHNKNGMLIKKKPKVMLQKVPAMLQKFAAMVQESSAMWQKSVLFYPYVAE